MSSDERSYQSSCITGTLPWRGLKMSLEQWLQNAWLRRADASVAEIQSLLEVVDRNLADAQAVGLSADGGFQHSYGAALQLCMIALRASGYQLPKGQGQYKRAIE